MGSVLSWITGPQKDPRTPVVGFAPRIKNIFRVHFRGLLGVLVPLLLLTWQPSKGRHDITVRCIWILMFWFMLMQPMAAPAAGFIPLFMLPMFGVLDTVKVAGSYFNDSICLFVVAGMLQMLLNSSGFDRRIILWLLCSGDNCQFAGKRLIFKACTAAFFLSMFSNRLITSSTIIQFLTPALTNLQSLTSKNRKEEPNYDEMRFIILNAVQTSASIGSITIIHAALTPIAMRAIWSSNVGGSEEYADIFNYLGYTCFAFPVAFLMFIFNFLYHMMLINCVIGKAMSANSMTEMRNFLVKQQNALPPRSCFEMETVFFYLFFLVVCLFRWSEWLNIGWATYNSDMPGAPKIKDATVACLFLVALSILPRSHNILKYINAQKKSDLGNVKPESAILWWKFVDKNTYYGYIILLGGGVALNTAIKTTDLTKAVTSDYGTFITNKSWNTSIFIVCLISVLLANIMTGIAACCTFLPFVLNMAGEGVSEVWKKRLYLGTLGVGIGTSFGFVSPFYFTPAYFCHHTGKVPLKKMVKYGIGSAIICLIILWLALCFYAPIIFDPEDKGIPVFTIGTQQTTET